MPLQEPVEALKVWLCCAVPPIAGSEVDVGGTTVAVLAATTPDQTLTVAEPAEFVAVTDTRIVNPTSAAARR